MFALLDLIVGIVHFYQLLLVAYVVLSWLVALGVVDRYNRIVTSSGDVLSRLCEPVLQPVRNLLQRVGLNLGGLDLSPLIVIFLLGYIPEFLYEMVAPVASPFIR
jgi:YggT family protein